MTGRREVLNEVAGFLTKLCRETEPYWAEVVHSALDTVLDLMGGGLPDEDMNMAGELFSVYCLLRDEDNELASRLFEAFRGPLTDFSVLVTGMAEDIKGTLKEED